MTLAEVNALTREAFMAAFGGVAEHSAWVAERAAASRPYADGCDTSPVGYLEGWYVDPDLRRTGVGAL